MKAALGDTELEVLHHVWGLQQATVADVHACILKERKVAYSTVLTVMRNLTKKGYLTYEKDGATYVYTPIRAASSVKLNLLENLMLKVFKGSPTALVQTLVRSDQLTDAERDELRAIINTMGTEEQDD